MIPRNQNVLFPIKLSNIEKSLITREIQREIHYKNVQSEKFERLKKQNLRLTTIGENSI